MGAGSNNHLLFRYLSPQIRRLGAARSNPSLKIDRGRAKAVHVGCKHLAPHNERAEGRPMRRRGGKPCQERADGHLLLTATDGEENGFWNPEGRSADVRLRGQKRRAIKRSDKWNLGIVNPPRGREALKRVLHLCLCVKRFCASVC